MMRKSLLRVEVLPSVLVFLLLPAAAILGDWLLHAFGLVQVGRYIGIAGSLVIVLSFGYSLRKRNLIRIGKPRAWLSVHEFMTWLGAMMVLVHAGVHFNAILPWLAVAGMLVNVASGLAGKFLLDRARRRMAASREHFQLRGLSKADIEEALYWDSVTLDLMAKWRAVHFPITLVFVTLSVGHIVGILMFWGWR